MTNSLHNLAGHRVAEPRTGFSAFKHSYPKFVDRIDALRREFNQRAASLRQMRPSPQHHAIRRLLRIRQYRELFAFDALKSCGQLTAATPTTVFDLGSQFNPFDGISDEPALVRDVSHSPGRRRLVCDFGPKRRMHQQPIARILRNVHPPLRNQFLFNGGMPMALAAIEAAISEGATHACEVDFVNFYGSVKLDDLADVMRPLPSSVTQHVIWDTSLREDAAFIYSSATRSTPTPEPPDGILLGSAVSPAASEVLIAKLLEAAQLPGVITYADNLCVLGQSEEQVAARIHTLQRAITGLPFACVSGLRLRYEGIRNVLDEHRPSVFQIEFASHQSLIEYDQQADHRRIVGWRPTPGRLAEFQISASDYTTIDDINRAISKVSNWRRYYTSWPDGDIYESEYIASLKARRFMLARSPENKADAMSAVVNAYLMREGLEEFADAGYRDFLPGFGGAAEQELDSAIRDRLLLILNTRTRQRQPPSPTLQRN